MRNLIVSIVLFALIYCYGGIEDYLFGFCFGIGYLSAFHIFYCINDYFVRKKKLEVMYKDLDYVFSPDFYKTDNNNNNNNNNDNDREKTDK